MKKANAVIGQSGGPTAVINASLAGAAAAARTNARIGRLYGMQFGIEGFMQESLIDLSSLSPARLKALRGTPSSALGSSRHKLAEADLPRILEILRRREIRYFFLIGGNDSMDTVNRVEAYCRREGYELAGVGIPKTVDNDLYGTDHTPGFASAARCNVLNVLQAGLLARDMRRVDRFAVYQTVGREAGWLAAAAALAKTDDASAPHLIYMPERPFVEERFLEDARACVEKYGYVFIVCGEGIKYPDGSPVSAARAQDKFGNVEFGAGGGASAAVNLHGLLRQRFGWRGEFQVPESLVMCAADRAAPADLREAAGCGAEAVRLAARGVSGCMVSIRRVSSKPYRSAYGRVALAEVAVRARPLPDEFINAEGNFASRAFLAWLKPLAGALPEYSSLAPGRTKRSSS